MSSFDEQIVRKIASIPVRPCRGRRDEFLPFLKKERALLRALKSAEKAYEKALEHQAIINHCVNLKKIFEEQKKFSHQFDQMLRRWKSLTPIARSDLAEVADYFLTIGKFGDDEEVLAKRPQLSGKALV